MMQRLFLCLLAPCLLFLLAGCQQPTPTNTPQLAATLSPEDALAETPAIELAPDVQKALDAMQTLASYRTRTLYSFTEKTITSTVSGLVTITVEYAKQPVETQRVLFEGSESGAEEIEHMETVRLGNTTWTNQGDSGWVQTTEENGTPFQSAGLIFDTPELLVSVNDAQLLGNAVINGIASKHYAFKKKQFQFFEAGLMDEASGEFWVAEDGGFIVKYTLQASGKDIVLSDEQRGEGTVQLTYAVENVNQPVAITPPPSTETALNGFAVGEFPMLSDAELHMSSRDFLSFITRQSLENAVKFYEEKLPALGWQLKPADSVRADGITNLVFEKSGNAGSPQVAISFTKDEETGQTRVFASTGEAP